MITYSLFLLILVQAVLLPNNLNGQLMDTAKIDSNIILNDYEASFLSEYFQGINDTFNFSYKKIIFVSGSSGSKLCNKSQYFHEINDYSKKYKKKIQTSLIILSLKEKEQSGYDAIILYWVKLFTKNRQKDILKQITIQSKEPRL